MTETPTEEARSTAWRYRPLGSRIGVLQLAENHLTYAEGDDVVFDAPLDQVQVEGWPSYGVAPNSQVKLRVAGKKYRICFVMPSNSKEAGQGTSAMPDLQRVQRLQNSVKTYEVGEKLGTTWRELLGD